MTNPTQNHVEGLTGHIMNAISSGTATGISVTTAVVAWIFAHHSQVLFTLTAMVFICQLIAFGYRFYRWVKYG